MKAISSLYVKFREKISALFARRLQSIKGTSFLHLPHSKLRVKPLNFGGGGRAGGGGAAFRTTTTTSYIRQVCYLAFPRVVTQCSWLREDLSGVALSDDRKNGCVAD